MIIEIDETTRNGKTLLSFVQYCIANPDHRFWQALRNWCGYPYVLVADTKPLHRDTFYWEGKGG